MDSTLIWYTARASGIVAYGLLSAGVIWGLAFSTRVTGRRPRPAWLLDLHRFLGAAALVFVAVHVTSILLDTYVHFGLVEVIVPFVGSWHPAAVAWGITAMYALVAVELTSLAKAKLPKRIWRGTHYAAFVAFALATVHGLTAGTDRHTWGLDAMFALASVVVVGLTAYRVHQRIEAKPARARAGLTQA